MKVLLIGSGGREHSLAWALAASPMLTKLYCAPGNGGIGQAAECIGLDTGDHTAVADFCKAEAISLVVVGPEAPLVAGLADDLEAQGIKVFGPSKAASQLEGSKGFTKDLCRRHAISLRPTIGRFADADAAKAYVEARGAPIVVKADGLAAGKGVIVAETMDQALERDRRLFRGRLRGGGRRGGDRGTPGGRRGQFLRAGGWRNRASTWRPPRTTSRYLTATVAPTPAAWGPIRPRP